MSRDGLPFLIIAGLAAALLFALSRAWDAQALRYLSGAAGCGYLMVCFFFRDPDRAVPSIPGAVVSAADGKVVSIRTVSGDSEWGLNGVQVSVFLSLFDVHVNRVPYSGRVKSVERRPGQFLAAYSERASVENEQVVMAIETAGRTVVVKQIAGVIARRIVCRAVPGERVRRGERYGLIRFGSRVDLILPPESEIRVRVGDTTRAGETIIGVLTT